jgi:hypothetical protein
MYSWLLKYFRKPLANLLIFIWYLILIMLVLFTLDFQAGRFRYLQW